MRISISGLGRMGSQIAMKLYEGGHDVFVHNRSKEPIDEMIVKGMKGSVDHDQVVPFFGDEQVVLWIMIPSDVLGEEIEKWLTILPKGSIIIDGGNSDYRQTRQRSLQVKSAGMTLLDIGTSGGVWGYKNGFSMMAGGESESFKKIEPALKSLALPNGGYEFFGESGSGHYVKMVHNAIEYGMMQSLAEGYRLLKDGPYKNLDLGKAGEIWQKRSVITSWLNELCRDALKENPNLEGIDGFVAESGEARWALETAKDLGIETPAIRASFDVRLESQKGKTNFATKLLSAMRNAFGGHKLNND